MLEFEQLKLRLNANEPELRDLKDALGYEKLKNEIDELEAKASAPDFWDSYNVLAIRLYCVYLSCSNI